MCNDLRVIQKFIVAAAAEKRSKNCFIHKNLKQDKVYIAMYSLDKFLMVSEHLSWKSQQNY